MSRNTHPCQSRSQIGPLQKDLKAQQHDLSRDESIGCDVDVLPDLEAIRDALFSIYTGVFEQLFGSLLANILPGSGSDETLHPAEQLSPPYGSSGEYLRPHPAISLFNLSCSLDQWMAERTCMNTSSISNDVRRENSSADECLLYAIYAFSARWLPLNYPNTDCYERSDKWYQDIALYFWRKARVKMLKAVNQICYRSVFAMMLFWLTPAPHAISKDEEMNGLSGTTCLQLALQMLQMLRSQPRTWQFSSSGTPVREKVLSDHIRTDINAEKKFLQAEAYVYWAATAFDTANSVTLDVQSVLCAGLLGIKAETTFELIRRSSLVFQERMQTQPPTDIDFTDNMAIQVISAAGLWKLYLYKRVAVFKEALRDGHHESKVLWAFEETIDAIQHFKNVYRPILDIYQRRLQFLNQKSRFEWCKYYLIHFHLYRTNVTSNSSPVHVILHWYLGILMLADSAASNGRSEFLERLTIPKAEAVQMVLTILKFGLESTFKPITNNESIGEVQQVSTAFFSTKLATAACFVAWDPYSHHTMAAVKFVFDARSSDFAEERIERDAFEHILFVLSLALTTMPCCSKYIQKTRHLVDETYRKLRRVSI